LIKLDDHYDCDYKYAIVIILNNLNSCTQSYSYGSFKC